MMTAQAVVDSRDRRGCSRAGARGTGFCFMPLLRVQAGRRRVPMRTVSTADHFEDHVRGQGLHADVIAAEGKPVVIGVHAQAARDRNPKRSVAQRLRGEQFKVSGPKSVMTWISVSVAKCA